MSFDSAQIALAWRDALALWDAQTQLSAPQAYEVKGRFTGDEPLAYIDLEQRQVVVNYPMLESIGAARSLTAVFAHELGHHLRFPHTLGLSAALELLQRQLLPGAASLTNLFFDLQVNEYVGRTRAPELAEVYQGFARREKKPASPLFAYYLAVYEELWGLQPGALMNPGTPAAMDAAFPGWRGDARMFTQTFYALTDAYSQFVYFCSRIIRYLPEKPEDGQGMPLAGDLPSPDFDDYAGALDGNGAIDRALEDAVSRGWIDADKAQGTGDPLDALNRASMPGSAILPFKEALVSRIYARLVERNLVKLPPVSNATLDPFLPTTTTDWEPGEALRSIDWTASIISRGALAALSPLRRELEPEPPAEESLKGIAVEIYLDTSGSMPAPATRTNVMTLAAQILSASAIRAGGRVKGVIYSSDFEQSEWMLSEDLAREYLLRYSGGGTQFPFPTLVENAAAKPDAIRVLISDSDFLYNVQTAPTVQGTKRPAYDPMALLAQGVMSSKLFIALLSLGDEAEARKVLAPALRLPNFRLARVSNPAELPQAAAKLAQALWEK